VNRTRLKPLIGIIALLIMTTSAAACSSGKSTAAAGSSSSTAAAGSSSAIASGTKIAFFLPNTSAIQFTTIAPQKFAAEVRSLCATCQVLQYNANSQASTQLSQAQAAMTQGAKVLVLQAFDAASMTGVVQQAKQKGITVIDFDTLIPDAPVSFYVTFNPTQVGQEIAQGLVDGMHQQGTLNKCVVVLKGDPTDTNTAAFWAGSEPILKSAGVHICYTSTTPGWAAAPAETEMQAAITKIGKNNIGGVYAMDDDLATGAVAALVTAGVTKMPPITGQNGAISAVQRILAGQQYMTVWKNVGIEAQTAAKIAVEVLEGKKPQGTSTTSNGTGSSIPTILLPAVIVTHSNIKSTEVAANYFSTVALCKAEYAAFCKSAGIGN
jgi:D-xylose transport system substrate-binding protein